MLFFLLNIEEKIEISITGEKIEIGWSRFLSIIAYRGKYRGGVEMLEAELRIWLNNICKFRLVWLSVEWVYVDWLKKNWIVDQTYFLWSGCGLFWFELRVFTWPANLFWKKWKKNSSKYILKMFILFYLYKSRLKRFIWNVMWKITRRQDDILFSKIND